MCSQMLLQNDTKDTDWYATNFSFLFILDKYDKSEVW